MRDAIEEYLDQVMTHASLAPRDHNRVRAELKDHLSELAAEARKHSSTHEEITAILENEFGRPEVIGKAISNAKGRVRTSLKKLKRGLPIAVAVCLVLVFSIRWAIAEPFYVPGKGAEPIIPQGSRILVYKLASVFHDGDVVAFRNPQGEKLLGIVKTDHGGHLTVSRNGEADLVVPHARVIGRVVAKLYLAGWQVSEGKKVKADAVVLPQAQPLPWIHTTADKTHFVCDGTDCRFVPWGFNYDHDQEGRLLEDYWADDWSKVAGDFREMKGLGANVVRIHLQLCRFMTSPEQPDEENLARLGQLVRLAEETGVYLDVTGLGCYHKNEVPAWYDAMDESARWKVQARFWSAVADVCKNSPAIFCYDLMNEPVPSGDHKGDWLPGEPLDGSYFVQRLTTDMRGRTENQVAKEWIAETSAAIRAVDKRHMITVGLACWEESFGPGARSAFCDPDVSAPLDFLSVHYYPRQGKLGDDLAILQNYDIGKPLVIEEIFPYSSDVETTESFMERSRTNVAGWISFYWGKTPDEYSKEPGTKAALAGSWLRHFCALRGKMSRGPAIGRASDLQGRDYSFSDAPHIAATGLVFLGTQCPISDRYVPELNRINASVPHTGDKQIQLLGVISDPTVTRAAAVQFAHDYKIEFPILFDASGELAQQFSPRMTPQAFVLDRRGAIQYEGRIDDTFIDLRKQREIAKHHDLLDALTAVATGQKPQSAETETVGCYFEPWNDKSKSTAVTYTRDIAPILNSNCVQCHRQGQIAPFSLLTYDQAAHHAKQIARVTDERLMPPWKALPGFGHFLDERRLTDREISLIAQWTQAGAPQGDPADLPPSPTFSDGGWTLGTPDIILQVPKPFTVPASGRDIYRVIPVHVDIPKDEYVVGFEFKPGATSVLHHAIFFLDDTGKARALEAASKDGQAGYRSFGGIGFTPSGHLGGWAPGAMPFFLPEGIGSPLRKGSDVVLQIHYHPDGKEHQDQSKLALYFAKKPIRQISITIPVITWKIDIPAGDAHYVRDVQITVPTDVTLYGVTPHMHLIGRQMDVTAYPPGGSTVPLININDWDFRWQDQYRYAEPIHLRRGTVIKLHAVYNNSTSNPDNPSNPPKRVTFGEQTTNEMCICFAQMTIDNWILSPGEMPSSDRGAILRHLFLGGTGPTTALAR